jgi:hypothetical protein
MARHLLPVSDPDVSHLRLPPHSIEAEQSLLGAILIDNGVLARISPIVDTSDFYADAHRLIHQHAHDLIAAGTPADVITVGESLLAAGKLDYIGGVAYLGSLAQNVPTVANAEHYAGIVRERARLRAMLTAASDVANAAAATGARSGDVLREALGSFESLNQSSVATPALDVAKLAATDAPAPDPRIERMAFCNTPGFFGAHGGTGKTQIGLAATIALAAGTSFFGQRVKPCAAAFVSTEEDETELHRRIAAQCHAMGVDLAALAGRAFFYDYTAGDPMLVTLDRGTAAPTARYLELRRDLRRHGVEFVTVDNFANVCPVDVIKPREITAAIALLGELAPRGGNALILGHVDKATAKAGYSSEGYTGAAPFNNRPRYRWFAYRPNADDDADPGGDQAPEDDGRRVIEVQKLNGGRAGLRIPLRIVTADGPRQGAIVLDGDNGGMVESIARRNELGAVLAAVREAEARGIPIPTATTNRSTAYEAIEAMPSYPSDLRGKRGKVRLFGLLRRLRADGALTVAEFRTAGRKGREGYRSAPIPHQ